MEKLRMFSSQQLTNMYVVYSLPMGLICQDN